MIPLNTLESRSNPLFSNALQPFSRGFRDSFLVKRGKPNILPSPKREKSRFVTVS